MTPTMTRIAAVVAGQTVKTDTSTFEALSAPRRRGAFVSMQVRDLRTGTRGHATFRADTTVAVIPD